MSEILTAQNVFPVAFGNEEETGMQTDVTGRIDEPYDLCDNLPQHTPQEDGSVTRMARADSRKLKFKKWRKFKNEHCTSTRCRYEQAECFYWSICD